MATEDFKILRIEGSISSISPGQIAVEGVADAELGFVMFGGKDYAGVSQKWLAKDKPGRLTTLGLIGPTTTGSDGLLRHDNVGAVTGGLITLEDLNDTIVDGPLGPAYWDRDAGDEFLFPVDTGDTLVVGDGAVSGPSYAFESYPDRGIFADVTGIGVSLSDGGALGYFEDDTGTLALSSDSLAIRGANGLELSSSSSGILLEALTNSVILQGEATNGILFDVAGTPTAIPFSASETEWLAYESTFDPGDSILATMVALSAGGASSYWDRDVGDEFLSPVDTGDTLVVGDGAVSGPSYAFESYPDRGIFADGTGIGVILSNGGALGYFEDDARTLVLSSDSLAIRGANGLELSSSSSGILLEALTDSVILQGEATDGIVFDVAGSPTAIPFSASETEWLAYESTFDPGDSILATMVALSAGGGVPAHNDTTSKQGGSGSEFYHLTAAEHSDLSDYLPVPAGAVVFGGAAGELHYKSTRLVYDQTNERLGVNNSSPNCGLHVGTWPGSQSFAGSNSVRISGELEVYGWIYSDQSLAVMRDTEYYAVHRTSTDDGAIIAIGNAGGEANRHLIFTDYANLAADHGHSSLDSHPRVYIHSVTDPATASNQWLSLTHSVTRGVITTGVGYLSFSASGSPSYAATPGDVYMNDTLEVDGGAYLGTVYSNTIYVSALRLMDDERIYFGTSSDASIKWETTNNTYDLLVLGIGNTSRQFVMCEAGDINVNWNHGNQTNPTLYIQSADGSAVSEYISFYHDGSHARVRSGTGCVALGTGTPSEAGALGDLYVQYTLEVGGNCYLDSTVYMGGDIDMNDNDIVDIKTATFETWEYIIALSSAATVAFDDYQKATVYLNGSTTVTITLNTPLGPGNFMLILRQGTATATTTVTFATEGSHALDLPEAGLSINGDLGSRTALGVYYDGSRWGIVGTPMEEELSS